MFKKAKLKAKINKCQKQIKSIEQKRSRSQAALIEAILSHSTPDDNDVDFFNKYTAEIDALRTTIQEFQLSLKNMN